MAKKRKANACLCRDGDGLRGSIPQGEVELWSGVERRLVSADRIPARADDAAAGAAPALEAAAAVAAAMVVAACVVAAGRGSQQEVAVFPQLLQAWQRAVRLEEAVAVGLPRLLVEPAVATAGDVPQGRGPRVHSGLPPALVIRGFIFLLLLPACRPTGERVSADTLRHEEARDRRRFEHSP